MNTIRDNELAMPSGYEVESATIVTPIEAGITPPSLGSPMSGPVGSSMSGGSHGSHEVSFRDKLDSLRAKGTEQLSSLKSRGSQQLETLKMRGSEQLETLKMRGGEKLHMLQHQLRDQTAVAKVELDRQVTNMNTSMRTNPSKWVGIAAGAGFAIGLIGRYMHWKNNHRRTMPNLVIVRAC